MTQLERALDGWRRSRHPRFARLAELASTEKRPLVGIGSDAANVSAWQRVFDLNDPLDTPRLVATITAGSPEQAADRLTLLLRREDPRVVNAVMRFIESPPYRASAFYDFCELVLREQPAATELDEDLEALANELEDRLRTRTSVDEAALLEEIYEEPDDDAPRLVLADALMERGDPRGEFIALQLQRARGDGTKAGFIRERELFRDVKLLAEFSKPLSQGARCHFTRGFVERLSIKNDGIIGLRELRTVKTVNELNLLSPLSARDFLLHPNASNVTSVHGITRMQFDTLGDALPWREVGLQFPTLHDDLKRLPQLETLFVSVMGEPYPVNGELSRLKAFHFNGRLAPNVLSRLTSAERISLNFPFGADGTVWNELRELTSLRTLVLRGEPAISGFNLPQLTSLTFDWQPNVDLERILDVAPNLKHLRIASPHHTRGIEALWSERLRQLEVAQFGIMKFERGLLTFTMPFTEALASFVTTFRHVPEYLARRAVLRHPNHDDPSAYWFELPKQEHLDMVRRANPALPVEVDWY